MVHYDFPTPDHDFDGMKLGYIGQGITVDDDEIRQLAYLDGSQFLQFAQMACRTARRRLNLQP